MKRITLFILVLCCAQFGFAQQYRQIPASHVQHPELGKHPKTSGFQEVAYELVHLRTQHAKTYLNTNKTQTTVQSASPLHYQDENGFWLTRDYRITQQGQQLVYPAQDPYVQFNSNTRSLSLFHSNHEIKLGKEVQFLFVDANNQLLKKMEGTTPSPTVESNNRLHFPNLVPHLDKQYTLYNEAIKSDYILQNKASFPASFNRFIIAEQLELPTGFSFKMGYNAAQKINQLFIVDANGQTVFTFHHPIVSDAKPVEKKFKHTHTPYEAIYEVIPQTGNRYTIQTILEASYLTAPERVYPITIDPVISIENNAIVNTCFAPNFQQSTLQVAVPAGQTVLYSDINYDFIATAGTDAWISDQRSFVSGPNGETAVFSGTGDQGGSFTYTINNSDIANVTSTGTIAFTFHFSRVWGGSGCNATFNFVNRREISVTYGTLEFGDGPIFINEYSASNRNFIDGFGRTEDWIELYNANPDTYFNLTGYHLSNDAADPTKWQIQNGVIPPNSRILVYCSRRDVSSGTVLYANFNLTQLRPDQIVLADPSGVVLESHEMFVTQTNHSYGRSTDGSATWRVFTAPTPGGANSGGFTTYATKPTFDVQPGRYQGSVTFTLTSTGENEVIRYTTNGSTPTLTSPLYTAPLTLNATTVVRARAFSTNPTVLPGFIETNTYFINENSSLPVFSFAGDANLSQLFGGNDSLRPLAHFEYFENDGTFIDENSGDFDKHGNDSWSYPQRGVDFVSRDDHGYKRRLEHPFFETSNRTRFSRLMVKAGASDNYPFEEGGAHIRDPFIQTLSQKVGLDLDERSSTHISLFVNGAYWGVYDLRERVDDNDYTDHYYGQDHTFNGSDVYLQYIKTWGGTEAEFGNAPAISDWTSLVEYVQDNNMGEAQHFDYVNSQLNINSLIDYFVINSFVVSRDWLNYNTGWWRGLDPSGEAQKWRYTLWDMDAALGHYTNFTGMPDVSATADPCQVEDLNVGDGHTQILRKLIQENPTARQMYVTRYADLLNTTLSCENVLQLYDEMIAVIAPEMPRQIARWGGNMQEWQNNVQDAREFLATRCAYLMNTGIGECYNLTGPFATTFNVQPANTGRIKMNSEWLASYPFQAQVFGNIETLLKAEANPGFVFSHWEVDGAVIQPNNENPDIVLQLSQATQVTAHFIDPTQTGDDLIYYWHFNTLDTPADVTTIVADYKLIQEASPLMTYTGTGERDIDSNNEGSTINLHLGEVAGRIARVRNPSVNRSLVFDLPTTGYQNIKFDYAVMRTNQGQLKNIVSYSLDGINFTQAGLTTTEFDVLTTFNLVQLDFTAIPGVNNNPNFKVRITFDGNTVASNGNNRFDNITLKGIPLPLSVDNPTITQLQLFPNPAKNEVNLISAQPIQKLEIFTLLGQSVSRFTVDNTTQTTLPTSALSDGIYLLQVSGENWNDTFKLVIKK
jgi:hypothetical protein